MNKLGIILASILLLSVINSTYYFLGVAKARVTEWIVFNACAPSSIMYLIGFMVFMITRDRAILLIATLPIFFFGGLGLVVFPWSGFYLIAQISHIIMVLNLAWAIVGTFTAGDFRSAVLGLLGSIVFFSPFIGYQQAYVYRHPEAVKKILGLENSDFQTDYGIGRDIEK